MRNHLVWFGIQLCLMLGVWAQEGPRFQDREPMPGLEEAIQFRVSQQFLEPGYLMLQLPEEGSPVLLGYRISGPVNGFEIRDENDVAMGDLDGLLARLCAQQPDDATRALALFQFLVEEIDDWYFPAQGHDLITEDVGAFLWRFGFGFCFDLSRVLVQFWNSVGLPARVVAWQHHTVAEVYFDNAWHLFDAQHRSFYLNEDGQIASFAELKAEPALLAQNLDEWGLDPIGYTAPYLASVYRQAEPVFMSLEDLPPLKQDQDFKMNLRNGEFFDLIFCEPARVFHPDSWFQNFGWESTQKEPPRPVLGRQTYAPSWVESMVEWSSVQNLEGSTVFTLDMATPFLFTSGTLRIPDQKQDIWVWVVVDQQRFLVGKTVNGQAIFSRFLNGCSQFQLQLEALGSGLLATDLGLDSLVVETQQQVSHLQNPHLHAGLNQVPVQFQAGAPWLSLWYQPQAADLGFEELVVDPTVPAEGEVVHLAFAVRNYGQARSVPSALKLFNTTTGLLVESTAALPSAQVPPLDAGQLAWVDVYWIADSRMTWYEKPGQLQLFEAWLDYRKDTADADRRNNRMAFTLQIQAENRSPIPVDRPR
ncbi:MAG: transglutaminase domain-containing protein [Acidobacteria bacterium]|nr:transglutaminase domain-containing protein [Acidobacteriota bacterium]